MKILNFGSCNIDLVYQVDHILKPGETLASSSMALHPGGKGLNLSIAVARAGAPLFHAGCVGNDDTILRPILKTNHVDLTHLKVVPGQTGQALIQVDKNGENCILLYAGANHAITKEHIDEVLACFEPGDLLVLQNEISNLFYLIEQASAFGLKIIFNPSPFRDELKTIDFNHLHCIIMNELEASAFAGSDNPDECLKILHAQYPSLHIVITMGKDGCLYHDGTKTYKQAAFPVHAIDTTAAGDTFGGYFVAGLYYGESAEELLRNASAAAGLATTKEGAAPSIPTRQEVELFLQTYNH